MPATATEYAPVLDEFIEFIERRSGVDDEEFLDFVQTSRVVVFYEPMHAWFFDRLDGITVPLDRSAEVDVVAYGGKRFTATEVLSVKSDDGRAVTHSMRSIHNWRRSLYLEVVMRGECTISRQAKIVSAGPIVIM